MLEARLLNLRSPQDTLAYEIHVRPSKLPYGSDPVASLVSKH